MIRVDLYSSDEGLRGFRIQGHAGAAPSGEDVVCAGVSAVAQTALLGLDAFLPGGFGWDLRADGWIDCFLVRELSPEEGRVSEIILGTLKLGLESIESNYRKYIKIKNGRREDAP
ncbi:MAG: ribosomal-processing cysteine protease Prp [Peptococcaceae bacterium]|jgi:uncharacterized protein YsxB (DUF464 family)|nr:ribosomal-processing cysteine protease Prp [Peptococcaceae bacterium]